MNILIATGEESLARVMTYHLQQFGVSVLCAETMADCANRVRTTPLALLIVDAALLLPANVETLCTLRSSASLPLLVLGDIMEPEHKTAASAVGADGYQTIPFYPPKLRQQIATLLRRRKLYWPLLPSPIRVGDLTVDPERYELRLPEKAIPLTRLQMDTLYFLAGHPNQFVPHGTLQSVIWYCRPSQKPMSYGRKDERLKWLLYDLRKRIEPDPHTPRYLQNKWGIGFGLFDGTGTLADHK